MDRWKRFVDWCRRPDMIKIRTFNPGISMAGLFKGAKVGSVSGVIYGAVNWLSVSIGINLPYGHVGNWFAGIMEDPGGSFFGPILVYIIVGVIGGLIFGSIFAALYDKLPGKTPTIKGIVTSIIFWFAILLGLPAVYNLYRWGFEGLYWFVYTSFYWEQAVIGLGPAILSGWLVGRFWTRERFGKL